MSGVAGARRSTGAEAIERDLSAYLRGLCPRCGAKTLFAGPVAFSKSCAACQLDLAAFNVGDGPAAFLTLGVGALVVIGAITLELAVEPPFLLHLLIWPLVTLALVIGGLRLAKAWLLTAEYRNAAREGRLRD